MVDRTEFLRAIRRNPDDLSLRLVFADWLDSQGGDQAGLGEFIRVQCQLEQLPRFAPEVYPLWERQQLLLRRHLATWRKNWPQYSEVRWGVRASGPASIGSYEVIEGCEALFGGMLEGVTFQTDRAWQEHAEELFNLETACVRRVHLGRPVTSFADSPLMQQVHSLHCDAADPQLGKRLAATLASAGCLRELDASLTLETYRDLLASGVLANLQKLVVLPPVPNPEASENSDSLAQEVALEIAGHEHFVNLEELAFVWRSIGLAGLDTLAQSSVLSTLKILALEDQAWGLDAGSGQPDPARDASVARLLQNEALSNLRDLYLGDNQHGPEIAQALGTAGHLRRLQRIDLNGCRLGGEGAEALAGGDHLSGLTWLDLSGNQIGARGAEALTGAAHLSELRVLILSSNNLTINSMRALARAVHFPHLRRLDLANNPLTDEGVKLLVEAGNCPNLEYLDLSNLGSQQKHGLTNKVADILEGSAWPNLKRLTLSGNQLSEEALQRLRSRLGAQTIVA